MWFGDIDITTQYPDMPAPEGTKRDPWRAPTRILAARGDKRAPGRRAVRAIARLLRHRKSRREAQRS
jgi:hypothetical protein